MYQTNRKFAAENEAYKNACTRADEILFARSSFHKSGIFHTSTRQASKFRLGKGIVYNIMTGKGI